MGAEPAAEGAGGGKTGAWVETAGGGGPGTEAELRTEIGDEAENPNGDRMSKAIKVFTAPPRKKVQAPRLSLRETMRLSAEQAFIADRAFVAE
jgi:hypothetical protein